MEASDVYKNTNPFLIWRFALNMDRRRLILFDLDQYISDPSLIMEPPCFLALLLLPMFLSGGKGLGCGRRHLEPGAHGLLVRDPARPPCP